MASLPPFAFGAGGEAPHDPMFPPGWYKGKGPWKFDPGSPSWGLWELRSVKGPLTAEGNVVDVGTGRG